MLSPAQDAPSPPPPSERSEGWLQAVLFLVLMAGAGAFAVMATRVQTPPAATGAEPRAAEALADVVVLPASSGIRLLVIVDSAERATALEVWRESNLVADSGPIIEVDISGPLPPGALEEAIAFANVACAHNGCEPVSVVDLRGR